MWKLFYEAIFDPTISGYYPHGEKIVFCNVTHRNMSPLYYYYDAFVCLAHNRWCYCFFAVKRLWFGKSFYRHWFQKLCFLSSCIANTIIWSILGKEAQGRWRPQDWKGWRAHCFCRFKRAGRGVCSCDGRHSIPGQHLHLIWAISKHASEADFHLGPIK